MIERRYTGVGYLRSKHRCLYNMLWISLWVLTYTLRQAGHIIGDVSTSALRASQLRRKQLWKLASRVAPKILEITVLIWAITCEGMEIANAPKSRLARF